MTLTQPSAMPARVVLEYESGEAARVVNRVARRLMPFLCLLYVVNYLDRTNVAMAKLQMLGDTGVTTAQYGLAAGFFFFIGYFIFEVPSNLILERVGARIWMARIMISWGLICSAMMFIRGPWSFYLLRFLLGVAEAGFFPGIVLYFTYWIPSSRRASVLSAFLVSTALSGVVGNPLAGLLMKMNGIAGLHGWQWLFLIEGMLPVVFGFVALYALADRPASARWLSAHDAAVLEGELAREHAQHSGHHVAELRHALKDHRLWLLSVIYFMLVMGLYGFIFWVPTIVDSVAVQTPLAVGIVSAIPFLVAAVSMVLIGKHADRHNERRWHVATCAVIAAVGVALICLCHSLITVIPAMCIAAIGIWGSLGPFWALSTRFLRGTAAAGGIAIINSIGALAGTVAPPVIGWVKTTTGHFTGGLLVVSGALLCGAVLVLCVPAAIDRNRLEPRMNADERG
jgi:MFS transporter, ACS family, tartrate transporter